MAPSPKIDHRLRAALLVMAACATASTGDVIVKALSSGYPVHQLLVMRCVTSIPVVTFIAAQQTGLGALRTPHWRKAILRGATLCLGFVLFTLSIAAIPIADAVALYFTMPFFVAALAPAFLGEVVPPHRWIAIAMGFAGVLVMTGFSRGFLEPAVLFAIGSAAAYAIGQMMNRRYSSVLPVPVMAFYQNAVYLSAGLLLGALFAFAPIEAAHHKSFEFLARPWIAPTGTDMLLACALGVFASAGMILFSSAYKTAEANFVAPFEYSGMLWALLFGYFIFHDVPDRWMAAGSAIIIAAGLFMIWADRHPLRRKKAAA